LSTNEKIKELVERLQRLTNKNQEIEARLKQVENKLNLKKPINSNQEIFMFVIFPC